MCRTADFCTELGEDPERWSVEAPLRTPAWFEEQIDCFVGALAAFVAGSRSRCLEIIAAMRNEEMQSWCIEHGQMSGQHRARRLGLPTPIPVPATHRAVPRSPRSFELAVFLRDGYRCRYCGIRLISSRLFNAFTDALAFDGFRKGPTNLDTHGIIHIANPVADHVEPWNLGGPTSLENLVSACGPCNYGKAHYAVEQIGLVDPRQQAPKLDGWQGLTEQVAVVRAIGQRVDQRR